MVISLSAYKERKRAGPQQEAARRFVRFVEHNDLPQYDTGEDLPGADD